MTGTRPPLAVTLAVAMALVAHVLMVGRDHGTAQAHAAADVPGSAPAGDHTASHLMFVLCLAVLVAAPLPRVRTVAAEANAQPIEPSRAVLRRAGRAPARAPPSARTRVETGVVLLV
jgi:hypothetical protein